MSGLSLRFRLVFRVSVGLTLMLNIRLGLRLMCDYKFSRKFKVKVNDRMFMVMVKFKVRISGLRWPLNLECYV